jgi:hypothetical protein
MLHRLNDNMTFCPVHIATSMTNLAKSATVHARTYARERAALAGIQDGTVDADELAFAVEQHAARVARVDGGVSLDDALDFGAKLCCLDLSLQAAHNALHL